MPAVSIEKAKAVVSEFVLVNQETSIDKIILGKDTSIIINKINNNLLWLPRFII